MNRKKIPEEIQADVLFRSNRECVVCDKSKKGDHIHHIDGDSSNNNIENLAFLCFDCHNEASITGSLRKKLTPKTIKKYREHKYQVIANERSVALGVFNSSISNLTTEKLLISSKNALIILEIEKIKREFFLAEWNKRSEILEQLIIYSNHTNPRVAIDVFKFLSLIADITRSGMPYKLALSILTSIVDFFPIIRGQDTKKELIELSNECINIAFSLVYDSTIHLQNYKITMCGLTILKYIYKKGKKNDVSEIPKKIKETYSEIESTLNRPERTDLKDTLELVLIFKEDISTGTLAYPLLPPHLIRLI